MQVIILAAGLGRRLGELTQSNTKCMVEVNGVRLIDRLLTQLSSYTFSRIVIVVGYEGKKLENYLGSEYKGLKIEYVENPIYDKTNNIYSLYLAKEQLIADDTILVESDIVLDNAIFDRLLFDSYQNLAVVSKYESWMDGTMVTLDHDNNIVSFVPKKAFNYNNIDSYYKTVNLYKFSKNFSKNLYVPFLEAYSKALGNNEYYEQVLRVLAMLDKTGLKALPLDGEKWYEIDDLQDLDIAETLFADPKDKLGLYQKRYGGYWRFPKLLDFCYLVNPFFPPVKMKSELKSMFDTLLTEYPSGLKVNSLLAAKYFGLKQDFICVGNGATELIKELMNTLSGTLGVVLPTFEEYPNRYENNSIISYIPDNKNFAYKATDLMNFFQNKKISSLLLINPDNPSGNYIQKDDVLELTAWAQKHDIKLIVDESFVDFTDRYFENSLLNNSILEKFPNIVVIKSISKSYGVPGLRLGVLASSDIKLINVVKEKVAIWNINSFAEFYLQIFGKYESDYNRACDEFIQERTWLLNQLAKISFLRVIPSQANYFLCEIISKYTSLQLAGILLENYNILIKDCGEKKAFSCGNYIRLSIRCRRDNEALIGALLELSK